MNSKDYLSQSTTITQPGVLVGLNSLLEQGGNITLPTKEVINRHPDAVVVMTTNVDYAGCRAMNQSVLDRMCLFEDMKLPDTEIVAQRAMAITGCTDEDLVSKMVEVTFSMAEYCHKNRISDGTCSMRGLINWIMSTRVTGDPHRSAIKTMISRATADPKDQEALITTVLEPVFAPRRRRRAI